MLRKIFVLAIALALGISALSTSAFARGGRFGCRMAGGGYGGYSGRVSSLDGGFHYGYGHRDVWGHWGGYYGPMI
jgi:hypothetical protein